MWEETLNVKIGAGKCTRCLIIFEEKLKRLLALFIPCLMNGALYYTVLPNNPCMLCCLTGSPLTVNIIEQTIYPTYSTFTIVLLSLNPLNCTDNKLSINLIPRLFLLHMKTCLGTRLASQIQIKKNK